MNRYLTVLILLSAAVFAWKHFGPTGSSAGNTAAEMSADRIESLAKTVQANEVVMYTTSECPYCRTAKAWLQQYHFAFTECNMSVDVQCEREFQSAGANGTPYLVIRRNGKEHQMRDGFDSDEFLDALQS